MSRWLREKKSPAGWVCSQLWNLATLRVSLKFSGQRDQGEEVFM